MTAEPKPEGQADLEPASQAWAATWLTGSSLRTPHVHGRGLNVTVGVEAANNLVRFRINPAGSRICA